MSITSPVRWNVTELRWSTERSTHQMIPQWFLLRIRKYSKSFANQIFQFFEGKKSRYPTRVYKEPSLLDATKARALNLYWRVLHDWIFTFLCPLDLQILQRDENWRYQVFTKSRACWTLPRQGRWVCWWMMRWSRSWPPVSRLPRAREKGRVRQKERAREGETGRERRREKEGGGGGGREGGGGGGGGGWGGGGGGGWGGGGGGEG